MNWKTVKHYDLTHQAHELTFSCFRKQPFLEDPEICNWLCDGIVSSKEKHGFHLWAYVIMPTHVHLLIWPEGEECSVSSFLRTMKQAVSRRVIGEARNQYPEELQKYETGWKYPEYLFWKPGSGYDRNITDVRALGNVVDYIHTNPVRRGLVDDPGEWIWSSFKEWEEPGLGVMPIDRDSFPVLGM